MNSTHPLSRLAFITLGSLALLASGCTDEVLTDGGTYDSVYSTAVKSSPIDVGGEWQWTRVEHLTFPAWVAEDIFGIPVEGPNMSAECTGSGNMTLVQNGATFTGTFQATSHSCVTKGGEVFQDPLVFIPDTITDGHVRGRSVSMFLDGQVVDCAYHATVSTLVGSTATTLDGGGRCIVPGHPKSTIPADPPPGGTSKTLTFTAVR